MTARQYSPIDVETVAVRIETVVATLQMAIEGLPQDGRGPARLEAAVAALKADTGGGA